MNILITGGAGFIGSSLARYCIEERHNVHIIDNLSTGKIANLYEILAKDQIKFTQNSVINFNVMEPLMRWADACFHLAAPVGVKYIMDNPRLTILDNIRSIDVVLELANKYKTRTLIASTSEVYGKNLDLLDPTGEYRLKEDDYRIEGSTANHRWAYANTKALNEFLALAYFKEERTPIIIVRLFNTVGPRQLSKYGMVLPNFIQKALKNEPITIYGDGQQKRSFIHVKDTVRALIMLMMEDKALGQVFNLGNPNELTILELAHLIKQRTKSESVIQFIPYEEAYGEGFEDMFRRTADISKLCSLIPFQMDYSLEDVISDMIAEYEKQAFQ